MTDINLLRKQYAKITADGYLPKKAGNRGWVRGQMMVDVKSYQRGLNGILSDPFYAKLREMSKEELGKLKKTLVEEAKLHYTPNWDNSYSKSLLKHISAISDIQDSRGW